MLMLPDQYPFFRHLQLLVHMDLHLHIVMVINNMFPIVWNKTTHMKDAEVYSLVYKE